MKISKGQTVRIEYEIKVKGGEVIDSSAKTGPVTYVQGEGKMLPALEAQLEGMEIGAEKKGTIPAAKAFGDESKLPIKDIPRREFPDKEKLDVGRIFEAKGPDGKPVRFKIVSADDKLAKVKFLHPLTDKDIDFRVKVLMIDDPKSRKRATVAPPPPPADAVGLKEEKN